MHFLVLGYDGTDAQAAARRLAARPAHLEQARTQFATGRWLYALAILDDEGRMVGSAIVCDFPSRSVLESEWLEREPYVTGRVWERIEIRQALIPQHLLEDAPRSAP